MPPKRPRRTSPATQGLSAGERLKRAKLSGYDRFAWTWVGTEVNNAAHITQEHRLATCGFNDSSAFQFCANKYRESVAKQEKTETKVAGGLDDDIIVVSDDETPACNVKNCRGNPHCLNYLGQEKWENEEKARTAYLKAIEFGPDPNDDSRVADTPVGLKNLGATCYANAYLQVWFQDIPFRRGVFKCQPNHHEEKFEESPIFQLQVTFAAMQLSRELAFNPVKLVESLKIRTTEQQDAQEFSKLFMAHLDSEFQKQSDPTLKSLIADQFQGKEVYATVCTRCHKRSQRDNDFLEIEVSLTNNAKLEERIAALLEPETLSGDNKYFCSACDSLQDAERHTEITELPPVLHFSLLRFVYDLTTMERKKSKQLISFPETLDMGQFLKSKQKSATRSNNSNKYQLRGILLHKGPSAYHGHYEAQIFDVATKTWYQFNDELVTKIDSLFPENKAQPKASQNGSQGTGKSTKALGKTKSGTIKKQPVRVDSDIEILDDDSSQKAPTPPTKDEHYISSRDAYMLVYARSSDTNGTPDSTATTLNKQTTAISNGTGLSPTPPQRAIEVVEAVNSEHAKVCADYAARKQEVEAEFRDIRQRIMGIYRSWHLSHSAEDTVIVSRQALEQWMSRHLTPPLRRKPDNDEKDDPMEVDEGMLTLANDDIICEHGKFSPETVPKLKRLKKSAYDNIIAQDGCQFSPILSPSDVCDECVERLFTERLYQIEHPRLVALLDEVCPVDEGQRAYWVSKNWLKGRWHIKAHYSDWRLAKPRMHKTSQGDPPPDDPEFNSHVKCEHGQLTPNIMSRRRISLAAYDVLRGIFPNWSTLSTDAEICVVCEALIHISKADKRGARIQAEEEKAKLKHMHDNALNGGIKLLEHVPCAVVPAQFIRTWKQWLFRPAELPRPETVDNAQYICQHGLLTLDPNSPDDLDATVAVITRTDWDTLETLYPGGPLIALERDGERWIHSPEVCEACREERKTSFELTELTIRVLRTEDVDPTPETFAARSSEKQEAAQPTLITYGSRKSGPIRQSRRIRQVKDVGRKEKIPVTRTMSVKDVKVLIQEELNIPTISQRLYYQGNELDDNEATIGSLGVHSNDTMDLREQPEDVDLLDSTSDVEPSRRREEGQGFGGTLLGNNGHTSNTPHSSQHEEEPESGTTGHSCPVCTFDNALDATVCAMCDTAFEAL
ncbi:cysteine proteinase [Trametopsis cervina]|nr:cysteine proteinase [Trametopsis cervina]